MELTKNLIREIVAEYPKTIKVIPRTEFETQLKSHLTKYLFKKSNV